VLRGEAADEAGGAEEDDVELTIWHEVTLRGALGERVTREAR
jgi:hypothetical protein